MSPRRVVALIHGLPSGSALDHARGGPRYWSDEVSAIMHVGHQIVCAVAASAGVKQSRMPDPPKPPEIGWTQKESDQEASRSARRERKARNWMRRYGAAAGLAMT